MIAAPTAKALTVEELAAQFEQYKQQQAQELAKIKQENAHLKTENQDLKSQFQQTQQQVESTAAAVESVSESYSTIDKAAQWFDKTTIGGYGELHYNNLNQKPGNTDGEPFREVDFHRFVLYFGHEFTDRLRFFSELELEHAFSSKEEEGEVELEQAFIEYDLLDRPYGIVDGANVRGGLFLVPVGILNETHEPPTFYGVERNDVESVILPTTWREAGVGTQINLLHGVSLDLGVTSGLEIDPNKGRIRSGRTHASKASADDLAYTARLRYTGIPGLEVAGTMQYQSDISQAQDDGADTGWLTEGHLIWTRDIGPGAVTFKGLYARWDISGDTIEAIKADDQDGWYVEPSYRFNPGTLVGMGNFGDVGVYSRYEVVNGVRKQDQFDQLEFGVNWWPHENVVVKLDYRNNENDVTGDLDFDGFDLGIGYQF